MLVKRFSGDSTEKLRRFIETAKVEVDKMELGGNTRLRGAVSGTNELYLQLIT